MTCNGHHDYPLLLLPLRHDVDHLVLPPEVRCLLLLVAGRTNERTEWGDGSGVEDVLSSVPIGRWEDARRMCSLNSNRDYWFGFRERIVLRTWTLSRCSPAAVLGWERHRRLLCCPIVAVSGWWDRHHRREHLSASSVESEGPSLSEGYMYQRTQQVGWRALVG